jgi:hypothetical protein
MVAVARLAGPAGWYLVASAVVANAVAAVLKALGYGSHPLFSPPVWLGWTAAVALWWASPDGHPFRPKRAAGALIGEMSVACDHWPLTTLGAAALAALAWGLARRRPRGGRARLGQGFLGWPVALATRDRFLHLHVMGPTGCGKSSSVLWPLIRQDLESGHGVALIEPKGDLARTVRAYALALGRTVVYWDPWLPDCPRFNPLAGDAAEAAEGLAWALDQLAEAGHPFYAALSRVQLMYAVMALKEAHGEATDLAMVLRFLTEAGFREETLLAVRDPAIRAYFSEQLGGLAERTAHEQRQGLIHRLQLLLVNPRIRRCLGAPADFGSDDVLRRGYVLIAPLSLAHFGQSAAAVGTLLWHQLAQAAYRRGSGLPFFLYLDEFHQYVTPDVGDFLALARGYNVGLVLAHQDLGQLTPQLAQGVLANARQRLIFGGLPPKDVATFSAGWPPSVAERLRRLPRGWALALLTRDGSPCPPAWLRLPQGRLLAMEQTQP